MPANFSTCLTLLCGAVLLACPSALRPQSASPAAAGRPNAPLPQRAQAQAASAFGAPSAQSGSNPQSSSSSATRRSKQQTAERQIRQQEKQRIAGVVPQFNVSYIRDAVSLTPGQKMRLALRTAVDPFQFAAAVLAAGYHEANDNYPGFGWGPAGFAKRTGAAYLDTFDGEILGDGFFPAIFHQDPRYFRLGYGTIAHRLLYAAATSYICKHDNTGRWEPNYSNVLGNLAAGAISNLYYPSENAGWGQTISSGFIVTTEGTLGGILAEFWPDISRRVLHRDPTHGADAQARAAWRAHKKIKKRPRRRGIQKP